MLCEKCNNEELESAGGKCELCPASTSSKTFRLCIPCARMKGQCRVCRQATGLQILRAVPWMSA